MINATEALKETLDARAARCEAVMKAVEKEILRAAYQGRTQAIVDWAISSENPGWVILTLEGLGYTASWTNEFRTLIVEWFPQRQRQRPLSNQGQAPSSQAPMRYPA